MLLAGVQNKSQRWLKPAVEFMNQVGESCDGCSNVKQLLVALNWKLERLQRTARHRRLRR